LAAVAREGQAVQEAPAELEATEVEAVPAALEVLGEGEVQEARAAVAARAVPVAVEEAVPVEGAVPVGEAAVEQEAEAAAAEVAVVVAVAVAVGVSGS
jgi:hypothetical protein